MDSKFIQKCKCVKIAQKFLREDKIAGLPFQVPKVFCEATVMETGSSGAAIKPVTRSSQHKGLGQTWSQMGIPI